MCISVSLILVVLLQIMASSPPLQASASRFGSFNFVYVSSDGQDSVEIGLNQLTPSSITRVFSVSHQKLVWPGRPFLIMLSFIMKTTKWRRGNGLAGQTQYRRVVPA